MGEYAEGDLQSARHHSKYLYFYRSSITFHNGRHKSIVDDLDDLEDLHRDLSEV